MKDQTPTLFGNEKMQALLMRDAMSGTLSHAYIVEGPDGSGRHTLIRRLIAVMACRDANERPCGTCDPCHKIFSDICPDVAFFGPGDHRTIGVDTVRELREGILIAPNDLDFKAYLIEKADAMTAQAQNALLKILEEPPSNVYFFLICEHSSALLPTVRSRAPVLRMQIFDRQTLGDYLRKTLPEAERLYRQDRNVFDAALMASGGCIGPAMRSFTGRGAGDGGRYETVFAMLERLIGADRAGWMLSCNDMPSKREDLSAFFSDFRSVLGGIAKSKRSLDNETFTVPEAERIGELALQIPAASVFAAEDVTREILTGLSVNTNIQLTQIRFLSRVWRAFYGS